MAEWNEALHPRVPRGSSGGGQFVSVEPKIGRLYYRGQTVSESTRRMKETAIREAERANLKTRDPYSMIVGAIEDVYYGRDEEVPHGLVAYAGSGQNRTPIAAISYHPMVGRGNIFVEHLGSTRFPYGHTLLSRVEKLAARMKGSVSLNSLKKAIPFYQTRGYKITSVEQGENFPLMTKHFKAKLGSA